MVLRRLVLVTLLAAFVSACSHSADGAPPSDKPDKKEGEMPANLPTATVILSPSGKPELRVKVKLARTDPERQRGLMFVEHLSDQEGMLFLFEQEEVHSFWMKNTYIPLDMVFIRSDLTVAGVVENAEPRTLTSRHVSVPSQFVLEVNGGWARSRGIAAGTRVRFEDMP